MAVLDLAADPPRRAAEAAAGGGGPPLGADYVLGLDGLRALSISVVVLGHLGFGAILPGGLGVTVFFFVSGYLITGLLMAEHARNGRVDLLRFYGRRFLRLTPELLAFLATAGLVFAPVFGQTFPPLQLVAALTYWTNYLILGGGGDCARCVTTGHLWSLAVEEHFYLLMPAALAACAFLPRRAAGVLLAVIAACALWRWAAFTRLGLSEVYTYKATECRLDSIAWGCLAAVGERSWPRGLAFVRRHAWALVAAGCALMLLSLAWRDEVFRATWRYSVQTAGLLLIVPALTRASKMAAVTRALEWAPLRWMGRRSYAAYLWHYVALTGASVLVGWGGADLEAAPHGTQLLALPMVLAGTWIAAELSHRFVYAPSQRLKPWLMPRRGPAPAV